VGPRAHRIGLIPVRLLAHKVRRNTDDYGWSVALKKAVAYLCRPIYFRQNYRLYRIKLETAKCRTEMVRDDFTFRIVTTQDADVIAQIEEMAEWLRGELTDRLAAGQLCLAALRDERVSAFYLIGFGRIILPLVKLERRLQNKDAWSEHIAVLKEFRKRRLASRLHYSVFEELKRRGYRRLYYGALRSNLASRQLAKAVGFTEIADVEYRKVPRCETWRYTRIRAGR
jgi:GNAT superfamily N-acetyltransferase